MTIRFHYRAEKTVVNPSFGFRIYTEMGTLITETYHLLHGVSISKVQPGAGHVDVLIDSLNLLPARYYLSLWITGESGQPIYDGDIRVALQVEPANIFRSGRLPDSRSGIVFFPQHWRVPEAK